MDGHRLHLMGFHMIYSHSFKERLDHLCVLDCLPVRSFARLLACLLVRCIANVDVCASLDGTHEDMTPNFIFHHEFFLMHASNSNTPNIVRLPLIHMLQMLSFFSLYFIFLRQFCWCAFCCSFHFGPFNAYEFTFNCLNINNNIGFLPLKNPASQCMVARAYVAYIYYMRCACVVFVLVGYIFFFALVSHIFSVIIGRSWSGGRERERESEKLMLFELCIMRD